MIINIALVFLTIFILLCFVLLIRSKGPFSRILFLGLLSSFVVCAVVLLAIDMKKSMYLDIAFTLALLSFMDIQFYAVYLRRKGDL